MTKSFQKSARILHELQPPHPGIIDPDNFNKHFELHCYEPSSDLQPFLVHIWTQRLRTSPVHTPIEISSGPNFYLFFTPESTYIHGIGKRFKYNPLTPGVIAGVKFRPGGFYPFLQKSISDLQGGRADISSVFPNANEQFRKRLLNQPDEKIVSMIEALLQSKYPQYHKKLDVIAEILTALDNDASLQTVEAISRAFGISERSLQLLFQTYVGVGLKWIIARKRLLEAAEQVQTKPRRHLTDIAIEFGYSSQSHFSSEFKKVIGLSPSQYINKH